MIMKVMLDEEDAETLISFIKMHEREEIPEDVWDLCMYLQEQVEELYN